MKYLILITFIINTLLQAQESTFITNGGFEGEPGIEEIPWGWQAGCGNINTPDTQPGWWNVENEPAQGTSYLNLLYKEDGTQESVFQKLKKPLPKGSCFLLEIKLAKACQDSISNLYHFDLNNPGDLTIRGSETFDCDNGQVLAVFKQVNNCQWRQYYAVFQTDSNIEYIYLEFDNGVSGEVNGSILIDDLKLDYTTPLPEKTYLLSYGETLSLQTTLESSNENWVLNQNLIAQDTAKFTANFLEDTFINLSYITDDSCLVFEPIKVLVDPLIPNVITQNNDNMNDMFYIKGLNEDAQLTVLNRWGNIVYFRPHYLNNWIPQHLTPGAYYYLLELRETERVYRGTLTIL